MIDFENAECSACSKKSVYVSTEIIEVKDGAIKKAFIFRCEDHIDTPLEEMIELMKKKNERR